MRAARITLNECTAGSTGARSLLKGRSSLNRLFARGRGSVDAGRCTSGDQRERGGLSKPASNEGIGDKGVAVNHGDRFQVDVLRGAAEPGLLRRPAAGHGGGALRKREVLPLKHAALPKKARDAALQHDASKFPRRQSKPPDPRALTPALPHKVARYPPHPPPPIV